MLKTIGALLPRDFLERQPKRWQKSQRKRRVVGLLRKMQTKREKVEEREMKHRIMDDLGGLPTKPIAPAAVVAAAAEDGVASGRGGGGGEGSRSAEPLTSAAAPESSSTPFDQQRGLWAAQLMPNRVLLVKLPDDVSLCLLRASIAAGPGGGPRRGGETRSAVRCRTPAKRLPTT